MQLTYDNKKFILLGSTGAGLTKTHWIKNFADDSFQTHNINEAVRFRQYADKKAAKVFAALLIRETPLPSGGLVSPLPLFDFQKERGVPFILSRSKAYIAHEPGLGKSAQSIVAVNSRPGRVLIVCPNFLKTTWAREITKWSAKDFPGISIVPETLRRHLINWKSDFVIVSDMMISKEWVIRGITQTDFNYVFVDEAHRFKTPTAGRSIALFGGLGKGFRSPGLIYKSDHVCFLSGTPMLNRPIELWPILFAAAPELIDSMPMQDFGFKYCGAFQDKLGHWNFNGHSNLDELRKSIMPRFMQVIKKKDVLTELPDKIRENVYITRDDRSKDVMDLDKKLSDNFAQYDLEDIKRLGEFATVRRYNGLAKAVWVADFVAAHLLLNSEEQILLFAHHRDVVEKLKQRLFHLSPEIINGGVSETERTRIEDEFQSGRCRLIIGNIDAMNLGLTLTKATRVVFAEYSWTPSQNEQAEDRAHRIGQKDSVFCQYLVLPDSIDEKILMAIRRKEKVIKEVMG